MTKRDFDEVIAAFDRTIKMAKYEHVAIRFNCIDISPVEDSRIPLCCPLHCPMHTECNSIGEATTKLTAREWRKRKVEFIRKSRREVK